MACTENASLALMFLFHIVKGIVKKKRLLYLVGQTRVHCDEVDGLGHFMELEVCFNAKLDKDINHPVG